MPKPTDKQLEAKLKKVQRALNKPKDKWEERDRQWLAATSEILAWVLGQSNEEPRSWEARV